MTTQKKNTTKKVLLAVGILAVIVVVILVFKPGITKTIYDKLRAPLVDKETVSQKKYDSLEAVRQTEYLKHIDQLSSKDIEIDLIKTDLENEKNKTYYYKQELFNYRNSGFNERFRIFSNTIREVHNQ